MMSKVPILTIVTLLAKLALSSTCRLQSAVEHADASEPRTVAGVPEQTYACEWVGRESIGVRLRFRLEAESVEGCTFACNRKEKFSGFEQRFVEAFSKNFVIDSTGQARCGCIVNGGPEDLFSFKSSEQLCTPANCWKVYVKHADLGAQFSERVHALGNYDGKCIPCEGLECSMSTFKRIGLSEEEKKIIFNAAASGDTEAQRVKEAIEELDVEPGQSVSPLVQENVQRPSTSNRIQVEQYRAQEPIEFIDDQVSSSRSEHRETNMFDASEATCIALIMTEATKVVTRLLAFASPECGIKYRELAEMSQRSDVELALSAASQSICKMSCLQHPVLVEPLDAGVPPECNESAHVSLFRWQETMHNVLMTVWNTCGSAADEHTLWNRSSTRKDTEHLADKIDDLVPQIIVGEDRGCPRHIASETIPENGQIGDACTLHYVAVHKWVRAASTCGKVRALKRTIVHSVDNVSYIDEEVTLHCYRPDGNAEMPEPGEKGICAIPKEKGCGNLECPCRPGFHCVRFLDTTPTFDGFDYQHFKCAAFVRPI